MGINFPSNPTNQQWFDPDGTKRTSYYYNSFEGVWIAAPYGTALPFNYAINPDFSVNQQGLAILGPSTAGKGIYLADRWVWQIYSNASTVVLLSPEPTPHNGAGMLQVLGVDTAQPVATGDYMMLSQYIYPERMDPFQWGTAAGQQMIIRFWIWIQPIPLTPNATYTYAVSVTSGLSDATGYSYIAPFTLQMNAAGESGAFQEVVIAVPPPAYPSNAWDGHVGGSAAYHSEITIEFGGGSYYGGVPGWQSGYHLYVPSYSQAQERVQRIYISDIGIYRDPDLTGRPPPWKNTGPQQNWHDCQRYAQRHMTGAGVGIDSTTTPYTACSQVYGGEMRIPPAYTVVGTILHAYSVAANPTLVSLAANYGNIYSLDASFNSTAANGKGNGVVLWGDTNNYIWADAR